MFVADLCKGSTADSDSVCLGSNPRSAAINETFFVYHGKRRFFLHFGQKQGKIKQNRADRLLRSPIFCFQRLPQPENAGVLFAFLSTCKETQKGTKIQDSNLSIVEKERRTAPK